MSQSDRGAVPLHVVFSTNASDRTFQIAIYSKIVQISYNKAFGVDRVPQSLGLRVVSYAPEAYNIFYGRGSRVNFRRESFD